MPKLWTKFLRHYTRFNAPNFPVTFAPWYLYVAVTNIRGEYDFSINLALDVQKQVVFSMNGKMGSDSPNSVIEMAIPVPNVPQEGTYTLTFNINGKQIGARFLDVKLRTITDSSGKG